MSLLSFTLYFQGEPEVLEFELFIFLYTHLTFLFTFSLHLTEIFSRNIFCCTQLMRKICRPTRLYFFEILYLSVYINIKKKRYHVLPQMIITICIPPFQNPFSPIPQQAPTSSSTTPYPLKSTKPS